MTRGAKSEWGKPAIIVAVLSLLSNAGWVAYGMSAKAKQDIEDRLGAVEAKQTAYDAVIPVRREMRDRQIGEILERLGRLELRR